MISDETPDTSPAEVPGSRYFRSDEGAIYQFGHLEDEAAAPLLADGWVEISVDEYEQALGALDDSAAMEAFEPGDPESVPDEELAGEPIDLGENAPAIDETTE